MIKFRASFDDGAKEDLRLAELMHKYAIPDVIFYIPADWSSLNANEGREPLSLYDLQQLDRDFEIGSHTITHPMLTRIDLEWAEQEIRDSKDMLNELLGSDITSFCYPRGYANPEIKELVRKHYDTARNTLVGSLTEPEDPIWETTTVHVGGKRRKEYEGTTWLDEAQWLLRQAIKMAENNQDPVYHFWGHSWELSKHDAWDDFEILLKEIKAVS